MKVSIWVGRWDTSGPLFKVHMHGKNRYYFDTEYFYKQELTFFHLTSINNLFSILNSRSFRLYNLHNSNDPQEYTNVGETLGLKELFIKQAKHQLYTFSFCPISEIDNETLWKIYGKNLGGVAIVFTIENDPRDWVRYHISDIKYNQTQRFYDYKKKLEDLISKYPNYQFECDLSPFIGFHKNKMWANEKEVRITSYQPYKETNEVWKYCYNDIRIEEGRNRIVSYIELPLWVNNDSPLMQPEALETSRMQLLPNDYFITKPKIKIKEIKVGTNCGIDISEFDTYRRVIRETFEIQFGYEINMDYGFFTLPRK